VSRIRQFLTDIATAIKRIEDYTQNGKEEFFSDPKTQDAVARNFEIIGEVVKRLPKTLLAQRPEIPWQDIAGFRDVLIHDYNDIDLDEVWLVVQNDLPHLRAAVEALLQSLPPTNEDAR
jgi:uncharacterized protein with HEPN domain